MIAAPSAMHRLRRLQTALLCGIAAGLLWRLALVAAGTIDSAHMRDFGRVYYAVQSSRAGGSLYAHTIATDEPQPPDGHLEPRPNLNPPAWHLFVWPFTSLLPRPAAWLWIGVNLLLLVGAAWRIRAPVSAHAVPAAVAWVAWSPLGVISAWTLQPIGVYAYLAAELTCAWHRRRWTAAGLWLGVLVSLKVFFLLPLAWLAWRRGLRPLAAAAATAGALAVAAAAAFGTRAALEWVHVLGQVSWVGESIDASLLGVLSRVCGASEWHRGVVAAPALARPLAVASAAIVIALGYRRLARNDDPGAELAVLLTTMLVVTPAGWIYYGWLLAPSIAAQWERRNIWLHAGLLAGLVPASVWLRLQPSAVMTLTLDSSAFWMMAAAWAWTLTLPRSDAAPRPATTASPIAPSPLHV